MADQTNVRINLTATDDMTPAFDRIIAGLQRLEQAGEQNTAWITQLSTLLGSQQQAAQATTQSTNQLAASYIAMAQAIQQQTQGYTQAQAAALAYKQQQDELREAVRKTKEEAAASGAIWSQVLSVAGGLGLATSIGAIANQMVAFAKSMIDVGARLELLRTSLNAVTGGAQQGAEAYRFITETANKYGFSLLSLSENYKQLAAATRGTSLEGEQTRKVFDAVSAGARTLGASNTQVHGAFMALEQMVSKGTVSMEELRRQLGNALPGAFEIAARAMGTTTRGLSDMVKSGELLAQDFLPKFAAQLQRELGGGAEAAGKTATAAFARLENEWTALKDRIAKSGPLAFVVTLAGSAAALLTGGAKADADLGRRAAAMLGQGATEAEVERAKGILAEGQAINEGPIQPTPEILTLRNRIGFRRLETSAAPRVAGAYETGQAATAAAQSKAEELDKLFESTRTQVDRVARLNTLAPERLGDTTDKSSRRIAELNSFLKVEKDQLEAIAKAADASGSALDATQEKNLAGLRASIRTREAEIEKIKEADKAEAQGERRGEAADRRAARAQVAEVARHARETAKMLADMRIQAELAEAIAQAGGDPEAERLAKNAAEEATQRQTIAEKGLGAAVEETAVGYLRQRQAAEDSAATIRVMVKEQRDRIQDLAKDLDIFGLNLSPDQEKARAFSKKIQDAVAVLQAPKEERPEVRLRAQAAKEGIALEPGDEAGLRRLTSLAEAQARAKEMDQIATRLAGNMRQTFDSLWEQVFTGGVTSFRQLAQVVGQSLSRMFAQLTSQIMNMLLNAATGTTGEKGGWEGVLAQKVVGLGTSLLGPSAPGADLAGEGFSFQAARGALFPHGLGAIQPVRLAAGGIVRTPSYATLAEMGQPEAVVPLPSGGRIPVAFTGQQSQPPQPIVIEIHNDYTNAVSPNSLKTGKREIIQHVINDYRSDGPIRRTFKAG